MSQLFVTLLLIWSFDLNLISAKGEIPPEKNFLDGGSKVIYSVTSMVDHAIAIQDFGVVSSLLPLFHGDDVNIHFQIDGRLMLELSQLPFVIQEFSDNKKFNLLISLGKLRDASGTLDVSIIKTIASQLAGLKGILLGSCDGSECLPDATLNEEYIQKLKGALGPDKIHVGFAYNSEKFCSQLKPLVESSDFVVIRVDFTTQVKFPESYGIFRARLKSIKERNSNLTSSKRKTVYYLKLSSFVNGTPPKTDLDYNLLLDQFGKRWASESNSSVIIEISNYTHFNSLGRNVTAIEREIEGRSKIIISSLHSSEALQNLTRSVPQALDIVSSTFEKIHVSHGLWDKIHTDYWNSEGSPLPSLSQPLTAIVEVNEIFNNSNQLMEKIQTTLLLREDFSEKNIHLESLVFFTYSSYGETARMQNIGDGDANKILGNTTSGCLFIFGKIENLNVTTSRDLVNMTKRHCSFIYNHATEFTWYVDLNLGEANHNSFSFDYYVKTVQSNLNKMLSGREELLKVKKGAKVFIKIFTATHDWMKKLEESNLQNFYCEEKLLKTNEYFEAIGNWARIHNFPVLLKDTFDGNIGNMKPSWWAQITPGEELSEEVKKIPHFVMRNMPENVVSWKSNPCVDWSEDVQKDGIKLDKDFSGVSVSMSLRKDGLSEREVRNILMFALKKFKTVELLPRQENQLEDLQTLNSLITKDKADFLEALVDFDILEGRLFMEFSVDGNDFPEILKEVDKLARAIAKGPKAGLQFAGVHLAKWGKKSRPEAVVEVVALGKKHGFKVGLTVTNCSELLNGIVVSSNNNKLPTTDYIICPTKNFPGHNEDRMDMARSLDGHLYMSSIFQKLLPKLSVFYRLNSFPCCDKDDDKTVTRKLFRFLNDVNQHAVGNRMKYFLVQAFTITGGSSSSSKSTSSWFHVESYENLSDPNVVFERELEFDKRKKSKVMWRPTAEFIKRKRTTSGYERLCGSATLLLLIISIIGIL